MAPERDEIDEKYKWNVEKIYSSRDQWEKEFEETDKEIGGLEQYRGSLGDSPEKLLEALRKREKVMRKIRKLSAYARMRSHEDTRKQEFQALSTRASSLSSRASSAASFFSPEIQQIDQERIDEFLQGDLEKYEHYIRDVRRMKEHTLEPEIEEVLADLGEVLGGPEEVYSLLTNADMEFPSVETPSGDNVKITFSNFTKLQKNPDRGFRRDVYESFYGEISRYRNTVAKTLENQVRTHVKLADRRNYGSALEAALKPSNIPVEVYENLVSTMKDSLEPLHEHLELKRSVLNLEELKMHDVYMPLARDEPEVEYQEAREHVLEALQPLGESYVEKARKGLESGWVDVYENRGKRSGAYSGGSYDTDPYILMNYQDDVSSMYTLAHELGHSMHSELTSENQPFIYSDYDLFVAEIASTVNENLLTRHLLENGDREMRRHVLSHALENFRNTFYRQAMFADFEKEIHEMVESGEALTPDVLDERYRKRKEMLYSPASLDESITREWMRIPHFYYNFYVFQYATGTSAAKVFASRILDGERKRYLEFLESGGSDYPLKLLEKAGLDMKDPGPLKKAVSDYSEMLDDMKEVVK